MSAIVLRMLHLMLSIVLSGIRLPNRDNNSSHDLSLRRRYTCLSEGGKSIGDKIRNNSILQSTVGSIESDYYKLVQLYFIYRAKDGLFPLLHCVTTVSKTEQGLLLGMEVKRPARHIQFVWLNIKSQL